VYIRIYGRKDATAGGSRRKKLSLVENKMFKQTACVCIYTYIMYIGR